ncbi:MAG TPA: bifunctional methylenetetrahydrofolate dehydrogenase/methenyltetrahydrofolate cyclohydrolase FolD [Candidatus Pullichristensenella stercorigallinarum]|uniref:Bifunctional protein FolD n=1 Tax=Candidatus Pullichristensenella stercorigallinarum TaxID=2840909 RepID=A0A9D0ZNF7_9FIRM|nr:bifunctional methylenetetrahydrofolate dehydrogenase/methenyltetrahydrofolate cyclohydrolase FolD [Candidatus Pullichristensenella stercorigallinarum]
MAKILDGKAIAAQIRAELKTRAEALRAGGTVPCLAVLLAGDDPASKIYVRNKKRACAEIGIESRELLFPESVTEEELIDQIRALNADASVDAMLVQLPLPKHINEARVLAEIAPEKDADGFHVVNAGRLFTGQESVLPCTPAGCMELLRRAGVEFCGKHAVVVGRSNIVGKPMAMLLLNEHCTVTICHSRTKDLARFTRDADILVAAVGRPGMITGDMVKPGAAVVDVGINRLESGKLMGDVDFATAEPVAGAITPVPGGVGPMTIAMLMQNTILAAEKRHGR